MAPISTLPEACMLRLIIGVLKLTCSAVLPVMVQPSKLTILLPLEESEKATTPPPLALMLPWWARKLGWRQAGHGMPHAVADPLSGSRTYGRAEWCAPPSHRTTPS